MRAMQRVERRARRRQIARVTNAAQIRRQVEFVARSAVFHRAPLRERRPNARTRERDHAHTDPRCIVDSIGEGSGNRRGRCLATAERRILRPHDEIDHDFRHPET
jgi:hypothetical protein